MGSRKTVKTEYSVEKYFDPVVTPVFVPKIEPVFEAIFDTLVKLEEESKTILPVAPLSPRSLKRQRKKAANERLKGMPVHLTKGLRGLIKSHRKTPFSCRRKSSKNLSSILLDFILF